MTMKEWCAEWLRWLTTEAAPGDLGIRSVDAPLTPTDEWKPVHCFGSPPTAPENDPERSVK